MYTYSFLVTRVIDGDSLEGVVDLGFGISYFLKIRLADIDTPEIFRPKLKGEKELGLKAKKVVEEQVLNKKVTLKTIKDKKGKYGRYLGYILLEDNIMLHEYLKEQKLTKRDLYN